MHGSIMSGLGINRFFFQASPRGLRNGCCPSSLQVHAKGVDTDTISTYAPNGWEQGLYLRRGGGGVLVDGLCLFITNGSDAAMIPEKEARD